MKRIYMLLQCIAILCVLFFGCGYVQYTDEFPDKTESNDTQTVIAEEPEAMEEIADQKEIEVESYIETECFIIEAPDDWHGLFLYELSPERKTGPFRGVPSRTLGISMSILTVQWIRQWFGQP